MKNKIAEAVLPLALDCLFITIPVRVDDANGASVATDRFQPTDGSLKQYQCPDWFRDAKFGIWAVWGLSI